MQVNDRHGRELAQTVSHDMHFTPSTPRGVARLRVGASRCVDGPEAWSCDGDSPCHRHRVVPWCILQFPLSSVAPSSASARQARALEMGHFGWSWARGAWPFASARQAQTVRGSHRRDRHPGRGRQPTERQADWLLRAFRRRLRRWAPSYNGSADFFVRTGNRLRDAGHLRTDGTDAGRQHRAGISADGRLRDVVSARPVVETRTLRRQTPSGPPVPTSTFHDRSTVSTVGASVATPERKPTPQRRPGINARPLRVFDSLQTLVGGDTNLRRTSPPRDVQTSTTTRTAFRRAAPERPPSLATISTRRPGSFSPTPHCSTPARIRCPAPLPRSSARASSCTRARARQDAPPLHRRPAARDEHRREAICRGRRHPALARPEWCSLGPYTRAAG